MEPLRIYLPGAHAGELVVYRHTDVKPGEEFQCGVSLPRRLKRGAARVEARTETGTSDRPTNYVADVATEADYEYVQAAGGTVEANREIEGILNVVEGVFQSELLVKLRISFQHVWATEEAPYPYTGTTFDSLLIALRVYWNENFAAEQDYDLVNFWTGKNIGGGRATGGVCLPGANNLARSGMARGSFQERYFVAAHEIAHNFGASDIYNDIPPILACENTLMDKLSPLTFCQFSRQEVADYLADYNSCLDTQPITLQPPTGLSARAASSFSINLAWQDNSSNESGFIARRRRLGSGVWVQIGTTAADTVTFSSDGLFSESTYLYHVQAFNGSVSSAYSNEAAATTLTGSAIVTDRRIHTIAGRNEGDGGPAIEAQLKYPGVVAVDGSGNLYIADTYNHRIRKVDTTGTITTVAGTGERGYGGDGDPAIEASLNVPAGVAVDNSGNLYIADLGNDRIRKVDTSGTITTVAGTGELGYSGDDGPAIEAQLKYPRHVAVDGSGNLYIADTYNHRIRKVDTTGTITTVAGQGGIGYASGDGDPAVEVSLSYPQGVAVDGSGNLYIADSAEHRIFRVDTSGIITTVAGTGEPGYSGDGGLAVEARLHSPEDVVVDGTGNLYIAVGGNQRIRRVDTTGTITTVAGSGQFGYGGDGGPATAARLYFPEGVAVDSSGNVYIADTRNHRIRKVDTSGTITTVAGIGDNMYSGDGAPATAARLNQPEGVAVDGSDNLYITDSENHRIRRADAAGIIATYAGTGESGYSGDGAPATAARLDYPRGVAVDSSGNVYIADTNNHRIRKVDSSGTITTVAGTGSTGLRLGGFSGDGGPATSAQLQHPSGVAVDSSGNLYIADTYNHRIRKVDSSGTITTVAGTGVSGFSGDGGMASAAMLDSPGDVAVDGSGNLYIADTYNSRIRRVDTMGTLTTIAGTGKHGDSGDGGPALKAQLNWPRDVAVDGSGNLYIADTDNHHIRVLSTDMTTPTVETIAITSNPVRQATYAANDVIRVTVTFSEAVVAAGMPQLAIDVGTGQRAAVYESGTGRRRWCSPTRWPRRTRTPTGSVSGQTL